jgi:hypothetical protein
MTSKDLYCTVTNCSTIRSVNTETSYGSISGSATIECDSTTLTLGDAVSIDLGYTDAHQVVMQGFVKKIETVKPDMVYRITMNDMLIRAVDYFLAADDPENPLTYHSISDLNLVNGLLGQAGLSTASTQPSPTFTYGTNSDGARFNLQSAADAIQTVCNITGRVCYAQAGNVIYADRKPYVVGGDTPVATWTSGNIVSISYEADNSRIRNRVVVYGKSPLHSTASAASSYVVVNQTAVLAHELLDSQTICDQTASVNLTLLNRLGRTWNLDLLGDASIFARTVYHITDSFTSSNDDVFVYRVSHQLDSSAGFITSVVAVA